MKPQIKVAFASGTDDLNVRLVARMREIYPDLPLYVVSEFPPGETDVRWIPYRPGRGFGENFARCREALRGKNIRLAGVMLVPNVPFRRMRLMALLLSPAGFLAFNENLNDFMLRPRCIPAIARHAAWRAGNWLRWGRHALRNADWKALWWYAAARAAARLTVHPGQTFSGVEDAISRQPGISVVIPSRNGRELLETQMPGIMRELPPAAEVIVIDNGSDDGTSEWLRSQWPATQVEVSAEPLSFARAVNRGIARAQYSHVCLLNNDMLLEPGFFSSLARAFDQVPDLFCATAQIRFPEGVRREETGKAVMAQGAPEDFPVRCDEPFPGEDQSWVLYGSGGCSLYDSAKLRALGGVDEVYAPAYVEDLDLGYRAWQRGWPTVYVGGALVEHRHRATTSRYYGEEELAAILEANYLTFLARAVAAPKLFRTLWARALRRLRLEARHKASYRAALRRAAGIALAGAGRAVPRLPADVEEGLLALNSGDVAVFPGKPESGKPRVLVASPYLPFPLSHGGAVRMYNLMRRAAAGCDQILIAFTEELAQPPAEVLAMCVEVVLVRRAGSHALPFSGRPDVVEEFASPAFREALRLSIAKWRPGVAQLEFTQMAQYARDCAPARTVLVEHDVTFDLYQQLLSLDDDPELRRQTALWRRFETAAWRDVSCVVAMSEKDRATVAGARAVALPNGVDLERFRPASRDPEPRRLLFIGSFAHLPNLLAVEFFLKEAWPLLDGVTLHIIAGKRPEYFLERYRERVSVDLAQPGIEVEGFVSDVRPAYERAAIVIAPLVASAGTNIKILEAMAMGKAVVSTPAGVNGLGLVPQHDFLLVNTAQEMASAIESLFADPSERRRIEGAARTRVERDFGWDSIARRQAELYRSLIAGRA